MMDDQLAPWEQIELALLRAEHQKQFQVMIDYIKRKVGEGVEYRNQVVRVVLSEAGVYYELNDLPEEFSGAVSAQVERRFVTSKEAIALLTLAVEAGRQATVEDTRHFSLIALYTRRGIVDRKNCYVYEFADPLISGRASLEVGKFQPGVMPLFYKFKVDSDYAQEMFGLPRGVVFCMANDGDRHLLVRIPYQGEQVVDLGSLPRSNLVH